MRHDSGMSRNSARPDDPALARFLAEELGVVADAAGPSAGWTVTAPLWLWRGGGAADAPAKGAWIFLTIGGDVAQAIRTASAGRSGGFGSVPVFATIGATRWRTSIFPSQSAGGYLLPVKAAVRRAERLASDATVTVLVELATTPR